VGGLDGVGLRSPRRRAGAGGTTGVSGSGKSSLAFDTLYAEGQRRYVESLSSYARQFIGQMERPKVDFIGGLSPAIAIEQKAVSKNPRSTVATVTEIYDYLRVLFARIGTPHCPSCGREVRAQSAQEIVEQVAALPEGTRFQVLAPVARNRKGTFKDTFAQARTDGFARVRVDGEVRSLDEKIELDKKKKHNVELVVDRVEAEVPPCSVSTRRWACARSATAWVPRSSSIPTISLFQTRACAKAACAPGAN
jgi:excinuclease ABC subunit A